ncbi:MAG: hypothetical protein ACI8QC_000031 [Planctomycetota bacterium]|jgi:hypothetical protein
MVTLRVAAMGRYFVLALALALQGYADGRASDGPPRAIRTAQKITSVSSARQEPESEGQSLPATRPDPTELALERGLEFLASQQSRTGTGALPCTHGAEFAPVGVTALGALAWMGGGSSLTRGPYSPQLKLAVKYLLDHQLQEGPAAGYITDSADQRSQTHGHGLATLALTQAYAQSPRSPQGARLQKAISAAVVRIEASQGIDGGWFYDPHPTTEQEGSVTVCLVWALRGARNAGFKVDAAVIAKAITYVKSLQAKNGGFRYSHSMPTTSVALTAASLSTLHATGIYEGAVVEDGYGYIWRELSARDLDSGQIDQPIFPFYERMYLSQALWQHRDTKIFWTWATPEQQRVLRAQHADGSWEDRRLSAGGDPVVARYGGAYATAVNCLFLAVPRGSLPVFTR